MNKSKTIDFIGIGAPKCATSWLAKCLEEHPEVLFSSKKSGKELHFFHQKGNNLQKVTRFDKGFIWYLEQFPPYQEGRIRGEFTPSYIYDDVAAQRMLDFNPNIKIIVSLRNPADMLYSYYNYAKGSLVLKAPQDFKEVLERDKLIKRGLYYEFLKRYFDIIPNENIHVILYDDIQARPEVVLKDLFEFLNIRDDFVSVSLDRKVNPTTEFRNIFFKKFVRIFVRKLRIMKFNRLIQFLCNDNYIRRIYLRIFKRSKERQPMDPSVRSKLNQYYKEDIKKLELLINRDLSIWGYE